MQKSDATSHKPRSRKHSRRWIQFSLRSMAVSLIAVSILVGVLSLSNDTAKQEKIITDQLSEYHAVVYFNYEYRDGQFLANPKPPGWRWLRKRLGKNYFARISYIQLPKGCPQEVFENVTNLKSLESIDIFNAKRIKSLDSIRDLSKLEQLSLNDCGALTSLDSIEPLYRLQELQLPGCSALKNLDALQSKKLRILDVTGSSLTNVDFLKGMDTLQELYLENSKQLVDVQVLGELNRLSKLDLRGCDQITLETIEKLKDRLPTTNVVSDY